MVQQAANLTYSLHSYTDHVYEGTPVLHAVGATSTRARFNFSFFVFAVLCCLLLLLFCMYHAVLQALYVVTAMVKQQSHFKVFPLRQLRMVFSSVRVFACVYHPQHNLADH